MKSVCKHLRNCLTDTAWYAGGRSGAGEADPSRFSSDQASAEYPCITTCMHLGCRQYIPGTTSQQLAREPASCDWAAAQHPSFMDGALKGSTSQHVSNGVCMTAGIPARLNLCLV